MDSRATPQDSDPHSQRMMFDTAEWHDRLARLVEMRRAHPGAEHAALDQPPPAALVDRFHETDGIARHRI